ncbi:hypothetical protein [Rhodococcus opacus]|uniref:hypothetical protein n=1 Tax=Rhodococcus opacus TaxID=37919 RepID=UPI001F5421F7|nr:hypothetical protein [Rhodococcus opacus]
MPSTFPTRCSISARGLEFFELFLPAATRLGYESRELADYYARFDAERGMRLHTLVHDVDILGRSLDTARTELDENERCVAALRTGWSGVAAAAAIDAADRQNVQADSTIGRLHDLAEVLFEANLTLSAAVTNKAYMVVSLHQPTVGGYSAAQIDVLARIYAEGKDGDNSAAKDCMEDASYWFPELADDDYRHVNGLYKDGGGGALRRLDRDDVVRRAAGITKDWLDANFRHVYEEKQQEFTAACADCAEAVHAAYDAVVAEARSIEVQPGFRPEDTPDPAPAPRAPEAHDADTVPAAAPAPAPAAPTAPATSPATNGPGVRPASIRWWRRGNHSDGCRTTDNRTTDNRTTDNRTTDGRCATDIRATADGCGASDGRRASDGYCPGPREHSRSG